MTELAGKQDFYTWEEFGLCRAAAGNGCFCCYAPPPQEKPSIEKLMETVFDLIRRGWLAESPSGFTAVGETGECFRLMQQARSVLFVYRREFQIPVCLLYGGGETFVSVQPGRRKGEYVGVSRYSYEELPEWIADLGMILPENLPDGLLDTGYTELQGAAALEFLSRNAADQLPEQPPEEIPWFVVRRKASDDGLPLGSLFLVRQPLFDQIVVKFQESARQRPYQTAALAEELESLLKG